MTTYSPRFLGSFKDLQQSPVNGAIDGEPTYGTNFNGGNDEPIPDKGHHSHTHFKSAQWSPDGTTILTSSADNILRSFVLPTDLLESSTPLTLKPYASHPIPEPTYATAFYPHFSLQNSASTLFLASLRSLPTRLYSPFAPSKVASYPLVSPTTEAFIAPHSLLFSSEEPNRFFAGSESCISLFDVQRDGEGPVSKMHTTTSRRGSGGVGMKGIVSALGMSPDGILAAGTFTRNVGLYDDSGSGGTVAIFPLQGPDNAAREGDEGQGTGITQLLWSACSRYLCAVERGSDGVGVWDVRGTGQRLAWLRGRKALTPQRLGVDIAGQEIWAGGTDGYVRVWEGLGMKEGSIDPVWEFKAHDDAVCATTLHASGSVLATASGQQHFYPGDHDGMEKDNDENVEEEERLYDNSLKLWGL